MYGTITKIKYNSRIRILLALSLCVSSFAFLDVSRPLKKILRTRTTMCVVLLLLLYVFLLTVVLFWFLFCSSNFDLFVSHERCTSARCDCWIVFEMCFKWTLQICLWLCRPSSPTTTTTATTMNWAWQTLRERERGERESRHRLLSQMALSLCRSVSLWLLAARRHQKFHCFCISCYFLSISFCFFGREA